ncbi:MAG: glycoside hydrolase 43 family protein [Rikenellaceae bacterium]
MNRLFALATSLILSLGITQAQVWVADQGDGTYTNPIIHGDYSDPDLIRVGNDFYMVASSFNCAPGIPILHSNDLVNWEIVNHVYTSIPYDAYKKVAHGLGSWAPSIRYNDGTFYVYFCTPGEGLFAATTTDPRGEWELHHVLNVERWEDPCPFWDEDGQAWLIRSKLCGGPVYLHKMSQDGLSLLDSGRIVYWDDEVDPILEGLKMMKRNSYYYILAPAGGVQTGWQTVLRSKNIEGPYESRRAIDEGNGINGPHQGGLVDTPTGEWWFIHFQSKESYGRIAHLQPAKWLDNDWLVIGDDSDGDGCGVPVLRHRKPNVGAEYPIKTPQTSDDFNAEKIGLQWQWHGAPQEKWYSLSANKGSMRLYATACPTEYGNLHFAPNLMLQKLQAPEFMATTKIDVSGLKVGERAGIITSGSKHTYLAVENHADGYKVVAYYGKYENCGFPPQAEASVDDIAESEIYLRVNITADQKCYYSFSLDGENFRQVGKVYSVVAGRWIGAKVGLFCINPDIADGEGYADFDYFDVSLVE